MGKWLLLIAVIVAVAWITGARRSRALPPERAARQAHRPGGRPLPSMVRCAHCGLHLPAAESVTSQDAAGHTSHFCSAAHRALGPVARDDA